MYRYHIKDSNGKVVERFKSAQDMMSYAMEFNLDDMSYTFGRIPSCNKIGKFKVVDSTNNLVRSGFDSWQGAYTFCITRGRTDWSIKEY